MTLVNGLPSDLMHACNVPAAELTDDDLLVLSEWDPRVGAERREERRQALAKHAQAEPAKAAPAPPQVAPPLKSLPGETPGAMLRRCGRQPASVRFVVKQGEATLKIVADVVADRDKAIDALRAEVAELKSELNQRPGLSYEGTWDATRTYGRGMVCTWDGSMWHCQTPSVGRKPGTDSTFWKLCVKRGQDGKDAA